MDKIPIIPARVTRVIDGESFEATAFLPFGITVEVNLRINGVMIAPRSEDYSEIRRSRDARMFVISKIGGRTIEILSLGRNSQNVYLVEVRYEESGQTKDLARELLAENLGYAATAKE